MKIRIEDYKGKPVFSLTDDDGKRVIISFGLKKAKAIIAYMPDIMEFVRSHDKQNDLV